MAERIPPHNEDAEKSVLGAALQSKTALNEVVETLNKEDFYSMEHAEIFDVLKDLTTQGTSADLVTVADALKKRGMLDKIGGTKYLATLSSMVPSPQNALQYGDIIREKASLRKLIEVSADIISDSYLEADAASDILEKAESNILSIAQKGQKSDFEDLQDVIQKNFERMEELSRLDNELIGLSTGFAQLDKKTLGLQKSEMIVLAARPSMGKTSLAMNIAVNAAIGSNATVLIFSLEMDAQALGQRLLSSTAGIDSEYIRTGRAIKDSEKREKLMAAAEELSNANIHIDSTSGISIAEMKNKCRRLKAKQGLDLVVIDYLQLMDFGTTGRAAARPENRQQEISTLSRMIKQLAREMECPVLILSQLSRRVEDRGGAPKLSDLRESGAIEQDADIVMFIHKRDEKSSEEEEGLPNADTTREILIAKNRMGETGPITLRWIAEHTKFGNYSREDDVNIIL